MSAAGVSVVAQRYTDPADSSTKAIQFRDNNGVTERSVDNGATWQELGGGGEAGDLPIASATTLGGVKVGSGLSITSTGVLSITSGGLALAIVLPFLGLDYLTGYSLGDATTLDGGISWSAPGEVMRYTYPGEATDRMDYTAGTYTSLAGGSVTGWATEGSGWAGPATVEMYT